MLNEHQRQTKSQLSVDLLDSAANSHYQMQAVEVAQANMMPIESQETGLSFHGRNASMPATEKKKKKPKIIYDGLSKEEIQHIKKEKRQRREWNKYKEKLVLERNKVTEQFHSSYYWNSFVIGG